MKTESTEKLLDDAVGASRTFNLIIQGFMGLALVIGVAALGVIAARSVVERRQQIGVLRAIGFRRGMIQLALVLESSFLALSAIATGTVLALSSPTTSSRTRPRNRPWTTSPSACPG